MTTSQLVPVAFPFYRPPLPDDRPLTPADPADFEQAVAHARHFDGRKRTRRGDAFMAELMAQHLAECLAQSEFVAMKRPRARSLEHWRRYAAQIAGSAATVCLQSGKGRIAI